MGGPPLIDESTRTPRESFTDKIGQEVRVGDRIAYGHALGRCAGLRIGKVLGIVQVRWSDMYDRKVDWSIRVQGIEDHYSWTREPRLCKPGTLQYPDRIVKITTPLPEAYAKLL